ncbi:MAG: NAD-dependent epimerase/dehydratase family protein [Melioribacteraceae bacterium]|nr:NAD-dependent epimerase/dehydratase family protein [Melioribacteraceae bacterium]
MIITGATGLIGSTITNKLIDKGDEVIVFSRSPNKAKEKLAGAFNYVKWHYDSLGDWTNEIDGTDVIIHLAGENIMSKRWNEAHKKKVLESRVNGTRNLVDAIGESENKPKVFICASGIDYYDDSIDAEYDEYGKAGSGFLTEVVKSWEEEAQKAEKHGVRSVSIQNRNCAR